MDYEFGITLDAAATTQRHTLYDSDEDETEIEKPEELFLVSDSTPDKSCLTLFLAVGQAASIFVRSYCVLEDNPVCRITSTQPTVIKDKYFPGSGGNDDNQSITISEVYSPKSSKEKCLVCVQEKQLKSEYLNIWCSKVMKHLQPKSVVILTSRPLVEHFSAYSSFEGSTLLRCLQTSSWTQSSLVTTLLEPPNTITGEAASALTYCQIHGMPGSLVVLYADSSQSTSECVHTFQPILKHPVIASQLSTKTKEEASRIAKKLIPKPREDLSTLYT